jgi:hypothetical protein
VFEHIGGDEGFGERGTVDEDSREVSTASTDARGAKRATTAASDDIPSTKTCVHRLTAQATA